MRVRFVALALATAPAVATAAELPSEYTPHSSSQDFALEFRVNYSKPEIDSASGLRGTPYETTFGSSRRLGFGAEFDWQFLRFPRLGSLGVGLGVGRWSTSAKARAASNGAETGDDTKLELWQFAGLGVFRVDAFTAVGIPLAPFVKAGVGHTIWRSFGPDGTYDSSKAGGNRSIGASYGLQWSAGVAVLLDHFDPSSAKNLDEATGVNNTYLFVEYTQARLRSASSDTALWVGGSSVAAGLALEF